jgi:Tol biopolymer transport system component
MGRLARGQLDDGDFEIFSMRANGKKPTQLTHNTTTDSIPDWQRLSRPAGRRVR